MFVAGQKYVMGHNRKNFPVPPASSLDPRVIPSIAPSITRPCICTVFNHIVILDSMGATVSTRNIVMIGLDGAGKTQLLYTMILNDDPGRFESTICMNYERLVVIKRPVRYILNIWDLPGSQMLRPMWGLFWAWTNVESVVWVINANDRSKFDENLEQLSLVCHDDGLRFSEFIVVLNIHDSSLLNRIKPEEFTQRVLEMPTIARRIQDNDMKVIELNAKDRKDLSEFKDMLCTNRDLHDQEIKLVTLGFPTVIAE